MSVEEQTRLAAIEEIYRAHLPEFRRVARAALGNSEAARDAVQEGFARAVRDRAAFRGEGPLIAWVWACVMNATRSAARSSVRFEETVTPLHLAAEAPPGQAADDDVRQMIARLPERQRLVLFLRHYGDLDYATIGAVLGVAEGTVAATLHSAHATLRQGLEASDE